MEERKRKREKNQFFPAIFHLHTHFPSHSSDIHLELLRSAGKIDCQKGFWENLIESDLSSPSSPSPKNVSTSSPGSIGLAGDL